MSRKIVASQTVGTQKTRTTWNRHGIDPDEVEQRFHDYMTYFDIRREPTDSIRSKKSRMCSGLDSAFRYSAAQFGPAPRLTAEPLDFSDCVMLPGPHEYMRRRWQTVLVLIAFAKFAGSDSHAESTCSR